MRFRNRTEAGRQLAERVAELDLVDPVVLALPRGGVPVAHEVAVALGAPLDVLVARKVGAPGQPELGVGAIAEGGARVSDPMTRRALGMGRERFDELASAEEAELARRVERYRGGRPLPPLEGRSVVVVDDGVATGVTARAALAAVRARRPARVVLAVPVAAPETVASLRREGYEVVALLEPADLVAVGRWYRDFSQTTDAEVIDLLARTGP